MSSFTRLERVSLTVCLQEWLTGDIAPWLESSRLTGEEPIYPGGLSPLHLLAQRGSAVLVRAALKAGFAADAADDYCRTPLMVASGLAVGLQAGAVSKGLLDAGASVSAGDRFGNRALHYAARSGNPGAFAALLSAGADPDTENRSGVSARALIDSRMDTELRRMLRRSEFDAVVVRDSGGY